MRLSKHAMPVRLALLATTGVLAAAEPAEESRLLAACQTLRQVPLSAPDLRVLADFARTTEQAPDLRSRAMAAYAAAVLLQGNTNTFARAQQVHRTTFPDDAALLPLTAEQYTAACADCGGGGRRAGTACPACLGRGHIFKLSPLVRTRYTALLEDIAARCRDNADFAARFLEASRETRDDARIERLHALTNQFARRPDLAPALALLDDGLAKRAARQLAQEEREARQRAEREAAALRTLAEGPDRARAIRALRDHLAVHPNEPAALDLQALLEELVAKQERQRLLRNVWTALALLLGILAAVPVLRFLLVRQHVRKVGPLPGMDRIDKTAFTDPLSLTAEDSRARVKRKTARIPPPDSTGSTD